MEFLPAWIHTPQFWAIALPIIALATVIWMIPGIVLTPLQTLTKRVFWSSNVISALLSFSRNAKIIPISPIERITFPDSRGANDPVY